MRQSPYIIEIEKDPQKMTMVIRYKPANSENETYQVWVLPCEVAQGLANRLFDSGFVPQPMKMAATEAPRMSPELAAWFKRLALDELKRVLDGQRQVEQEALAWKAGAALG